MPEKKVENKKTYVTKIHCYNCQNILDVEIPFGTSLKKWLTNKNALCKHCGCSPICY